MKKERIFWGVFLIIGAIFLLISKLGYFSDINVFSLLLTVCLIAIMIKSLLRLNFAGILFPIAFIGIIYDEQLGITEITPWTILVAALLGSIGLSMIFHKSSKWSKINQDWDEDEWETIDVEDGSHIKLETSFASSIKYVNTDKFEQADLRCRFGGMKVYFDNAIMHKGSAVVNIEASFSGMELYIPRTWKVDNKTNASFGGVEEKNKNNGVLTETLTLVGNINFSGVEITYI